MSVRRESVDGTTWPVDVGELEWKLRYAPKAARPKTAASVVAAYGYLVDPTITQAVAIAALKRARAAQIVADRDEVREGVTVTLDDATYEAVRRALRHVDASDPCPLCGEWPEHNPVCVMADPRLDAVIGRGFVKP